MDRSGKAVPVRNRRERRDRPTLGERSRRLVLVGMMGSGKTTVGRLLADRLAWPFVDVDEEIVKSAGQVIGEIFAVVGEAGFRAEERRVLAALLADDADVPGEPSVVSVGGGAVLDEENRSVLRARGTVVWLRASPGTLEQRVGDGTGRPLLAGDPAGTLRRLDEERAALYQEVADVVVDVDGTDVAGVVDLVETELRRAERWPA
jgi:shikimate kinase